MTTEKEDRYAGMSDEERQFVEGFEGSDEVVGQPEPKADTEQKDSAEGVDIASGDTDPAAQDDFTASLPEDLRNRWQELESANRTLAANLDAIKSAEAQLRNDNAAMAGRLGPLQRKLAEIERQAPAQQPAPQAKQATDDDVDALFKTDSWAEFERMFPTEAEVQKAVVLGAVNLTKTQLQQALAKVDQRLDSFAPTIQQAAQFAQQSESERRAAKLAAEHPDFQQIDASPEFRDWLERDWMGSLPAPFRQQLQDKNARNELFSDPVEVSRILTQFKSSRPTQASAPATQTTAQPRAVDPRLALSATPSLPTSASRPLNWAGMTPDEQFLAGLNFPE